MAMFHENLDDDECRRAIAWLQTDLSEPFKTEDGPPLRELRPLFGSFAIIPRGN